jgi:hypothetical protein
MRRIARSPKRLEKASKVRRSKGSGGKSGVDAVFADFLAVEQ